MNRREPFGKRNESNAAVSRATIVRPEPMSCRRPTVLREVPCGNSPALVCVAKEAVTAIPSAATSNAKDRGLPRVLDLTNTAVAVSDTAQARKPHVISQPSCP